jgi:hypothetical protein
LSKRGAFVLLLLVGAVGSAAADPQEREALLRDLRGKDAEKRVWAAVYVLKKIDSSHEEALAVLRERMREKKDWYPIDVFHLARESSAVRKLLLDTSADRKADLASRKVALRCVRDLGPLAKEGVPQLIACLDEQYPIASAVAECLGAMKGDAKAAIKPLEERVRKDPSTRSVIDLKYASMAQALVQIDPGNAVAIECLTRYLPGRYWEHRSTGVFGLSDCPKLPPETIEELKRMAENDPYPTLRREARKILERLADKP